MVFMDLEEDFVLTLTAFLAAFVVTAEAFFAVRLAVVCAASLVSFWAWITRVAAPLA